MKKLLSMLLVSVLLFGVLSVTVSADSAILLSPQQGDIRTTNSTYFTETTDADTGLVTSRVIDGSSISSATTIAKTETNTFGYTTVTSYSAGSTPRFKNNFTWEFDFCFDTPPSTAGDNGMFQLLFGSTWANAIQFKSITNHTDYYYIKFGDSREASETAISAPGSGGWWWYASAYNLYKGNTYHLKIEVDVRNNRIYTTFTNPYVTVTKNEDGTETVTKHDTPQTENIYVRTASSNASSTLGFTQDTLDAVKTSTNSLNVVLQPKSAIKLTTSNEEFYMDKFWSMTPEVTTADNSVTTKVNVINVTNSKYWTTMPCLICALYKDNKLEAYNTNAPYASGTDTLTDYYYEAAIDTSELEDGEYTLKTFVWNDFSRIMPYPNCYAEKILTIENGVPTLSE